MVTLIDNGHGDDTPGKCSPDGQHREFRWTRDFAERLCTALAIILSSCSSTRTVTVPERHEVVVHQRDTTSQRDSIFVHDSICITRLGNTILQKEYHVVYKDRWRDRLRVDSFIQRDTVTVVKEVEKPPNRWQQTKMHLGSTLIWMLLASLAFFAIRAIIYRYKRG